MTDKLEEDVSTKDMGAQDNGSETTLILFQNLIPKKNNYTAPQSNNGSISLQYMPRQSGNNSLSTIKASKKSDSINQVFIWFIGFLLSVIPYIILKIQANRGKNSELICLEIFASKDLFLVYVGLLISPFCYLLMSKKSKDSPNGLNTILLFLGIVLLIIMLSYTFYFLSYDKTEVVKENGWNWFIAIMNMACFLATCIVSIILYIKASK